MFATATRLADRAVRHLRPAPQAAGWLKREEAIMGTAITVELWADDARAGANAADAVMAEMHRINETMSPVKPGSELSRINREAADAPVRVSAEMFGLLERALAFSRLSQGAFDITYASVGQHYDYRAGLAPDAATLEAARRAVGWQFLLLDEHRRTVRFARQGMRIDLGGFAKGHAVDNAAAILQRHGVAQAMVSAGGDSRILGDRRGRPWHIAVRDPRREGEVVAVLPLEDTAISTSGDYERYFERGGVRCHHIIDPATGRSPEGVRSVTILAPDGLTAEGLSKTVFVKGVAEGLRIVEGFGGVDAVVVDGQGRLHATRGLREGAVAAPR